MLYFRVFFCFFVFVSLFQFVKESQNASWDLIMQIEAAEKINSGIDVYNAERDWVKSTRYPPWILFALQPLATFDKEKAILTFSIIQVVLFAMLLLFLRNKMQPLVGSTKADLYLFMLFLFFYEIFRETVISGNAIFIIFLAASFCLIYHNKNKISQFILPVIALYFLSTKIFTLLPTIQIIRFEKNKIRKTGSILLTVTMISFVLTWILSSNFINTSPFQLLKDWLIENQKLNQIISPYILRGPLNPSISTAITNSFNIINWPIYFDLIFSCGATLALVLIYFFRSKKTQHLQVNLFWLFSMTPLLHPTPWKHLYIFSMPLVTLILFSFNKWSFLEKFALFSLTLRLAFGSNRIVNAPDQFTHLDHFVPWGFCYFVLILWATLNYNKLCQYYDELLLQRKNFGSSF